MPTGYDVSELRRLAMKLEFLYTPVSDMKAALGLYRDALGCEEAWREGDSTVSLKLPGTDVQLMLDEDESGGGVGPIFVVESVESFHAGRPSELSVREKPQEIPGGYLATYEDASGNPIYVMDQVLESSGAEAASGAVEAV
jgi:catechol 2,3-dioxygenase-like lactoylglutathione lyase family enzyme